jgi:hypothetical protein
MTVAAAANATEKPVTAKLITPRGDAIKHLKRVLDRGVEIKTMRIRNGDELDEARAHKLEWVQDVTDLLNQLFDNTSVADYVNDWVGKVFPEYAEFGNFVDQFFEEMDYRLNKLRVIYKRIESAGEGGQSNAPSSPSSAGNGNGTASEKTHEPAESPHSSPNTESHMPAAAAANAAPGGHKILFVSHGPKDPSSEAVLLFVQQLSLPVMEADHTNGLIETLEGRNDMGFAIVMNAADHVEQGKGAISENSLFKLGYCAGKIGLKRMCMMHAPTHPGGAGEAHGISHLAVDNNGGWQLHLARQMKRAGLDIDLNRLV